MNKNIKKWNNTDKVYPLEKTLNCFIEEEAEKTPSATALTYEEKSYSYKLLNNQVNRLAHCLQSKGVVPETLVGICAYRSPEMVIGLLAIIKAGGAYVPFDPTYPAKRIAFMINDSNVSIIIAHKSCRKLLSQTSSKVIYFEDIADELNNYPSTNPQADVNADNLAYVIYTSGSTGNPKGVMITHRAIVNRLLWMQDTFKIRTSDTLIQKTPFSFDVSVWEFFWPLMYGARLVIAEPEGHKDPEYLLDLIARERISFIHFVPSMLRLFLDAADPKRCASLRHVVVSGETLTIDLQQKFFQTLEAQLHNLYGPTEAAVDVSYWKCTPEMVTSTVPIGRPISNIRLYILDKDGQQVSVGEKGELHIGGVGVARGYLNRPNLTAKNFIPDPFSIDPSARLYKTGDLCRYLPDGNIEYLGRSDCQVKIRGNRIELGEIEAKILTGSSVQQCAVIAREDSPSEKHLVAYIVAIEGRFSQTTLRKKLAKELPTYMIPSVFVLLPQLPLTPSGKIDRLALPKPERTRPKLATQYIAPRTETEKKMALVWCEILHLSEVGIDDNFFELGGDSLSGLKMTSRLHSVYDISLPIVKLFEFPSIAKLANLIDHSQDNLSGIEKINEMATRQRIGRFQNDPRQDGIAIIGMAGRFPGANSIDQLWANLCSEIESISFFSPNELKPYVEEELIDDHDYVPARGLIQDADKFDASFFGISPQEAKLMDPQQRVFMELAWAALENAGYDSESFNGMIGVYAGVGDNHYYPFNVLSYPDLVNAVGKVIIGYGNEKDYIATRVSYALNLTGPSVSANTGCSTSLLAVDNAFRALVNYECDMAMAGGIDIFVPQKSGFLYQEGGIFSRDGHCRPFDYKATGTLFCDGAGIVILKRLTDALSDGDKIYAVIRGSAKNNDGSNKLSFLAPSVDGQAQVIAMAQAHANVLAEDISFIEGHGTGTPLGDPIEIEALTKVFESQTTKKQFCFIGSIKGNIGHPTIASGIAGLIKASLCLYHEKIPATLHYQRPNPKIDFENSPFKVVDKLTLWRRSKRPRIAGVSSFGFGGTNVHCIVEEPPIVEPSGLSRPRQLLLASAKTANALGLTVGNLKTFLEQNPEIDLADTAFTLQQGRRHFAHRRFAVCRDVADAVEMLKDPDPMRSQTRICEERDPGICFMFPGQGAQYVNMGKNLYEHESLFKEVVDTCCEILQPALACDLREFLYPRDEDIEKVNELLKNTFYTQAALFTIEYALARLMQHWGIQPSTMIGHSIGEFVCACLADVFSLEDVLRLVALRGRLISDLPQGSMLSIRANTDTIESRLPSSIQLAAANSPTLCVVSGPTDAIKRYQKTLEIQDIPCKILHTSHAFHSAMMEPIVDSFIKEVSKVKLGRPQIPFVSTVTTSWITEVEATDPTYWGRHLRMPVRFSHGLNTLLKKEDFIFVEVGPRATCATLTRQHLATLKKVAVTATLGEASNNNAEWTALLSALGYLWLHGVTPDWQAFYSGETRHRIPLPTYPFESRSHWVHAKPRQPSSEVTSSLQTHLDLNKEKATCNKRQRTEKAEDSLASYLITCIEDASGQSLKGVDSSTTFLELGMDSLLLSQLANKIKIEFGIKILFSELMREISTIQLLTDHIRTFRKQKNKIPYVARQEMLESDSVQSSVEIPVTVPQRGLWLSSKLSEEFSCAYNESITLHLSGNINFTLVEKSINGLVQKHDALRSTFSDDGKTMTITPKEAIKIERIDLCKIKEKEAHDKFNSILHRDATKPFNFEYGPLLRCYIIVMPNKQCYIVFTSHHIVCDGWSLDNLIYDFCAYYNRLWRGKKIRFERSYAFTDYAYMSNARLKTSEYAKARHYWLSRFKKVFPVLRLPAEKPRGKMVSCAAKRIDRTISGDVVGRIKDICKIKGCSLFTVLVAAFKLVLWRISGEENFVVGLPIAEQPLIGCEDLVGHCVNLIPFWCPPQETMTYEDYIEAVQLSLLEAYDHAIYGYIDLLNEQEVIQSDYTISTPVPAGLTTITKFEVEELHISNAKVDYFANPRAHESFEIYLNVVETEISFELKCHFKTELFSHRTIRTWLELYEKTLKQIVNNSTVQIGTITSKKHFQPTTVRIGSTSSKNTNDIVGRLLPIWQKVINRYSIGPHDNFFRLGGNSILAGRLVIEVEKNFGKCLPLSIIFETPTVAKMAEILKNNKYDANYFRSLVEIQPKGTLPPLFLIHSESGNVVEYYALSKHLSQNQPLYGIQAREAFREKVETNSFSIERMATRYINEVKRKQPSGPYYLGGYCLGGLIAFEMARQMEAEGEKIEFLGLISTSTPAYTENYIAGKTIYQRILSFYNARIKPDVEDFRFIMPEARIAFLENRIRTVSSIIKARIESHTTFLLDKLCSDRITHSRDYYLAQMKSFFYAAYMTYIPKPIKSHLFLFRPGIQLKHLSPDPTLGWENLSASGVIDYEIYCYHKNILKEPNIEQLAVDLKTCLSKTQSAINYASTKCCLCKETAR